MLGFENKMLLLVESEIDKKVFITTDMDSAIKQIKYYNEGTIGFDIPITNFKFRWIPYYERI